MVMQIKLLVLLLVSWKFQQILFSTTSVVFTRLNRLSKTKATGLDNISARLFRECADFISGQLWDLFNKSPVGHLGIFWVGMCRPGLQIGTPFLKKISPKIDTPF